MGHEEIIKSLRERYSFSGDKITKEHEEIEKYLLDVSNIKISIWTFWRIFPLLKKLKAAVSLIGVISASSLKEQINLQQTQLDCLEIQKAFQMQLDELKERIKDG